MATRRPYPELTYNPITLIGAGLALFGLAATLILAVMEWARHGENPYLGIFYLVVFPSILVFGLLLIPIGMWREKRRRERGDAKPWVIDLANRTHRNAMVTFIAGTCIFLLLTTVGLYETYHFTESVTFCGEVCHAVMEPEHTAHAVNTHAGITCVACHVGPGPQGYVESKISGVRQLIGVITDDYARPVPVPVHNFPEVTAVCEGCHWPGQDHGGNQVWRDHYLSDRANTPWRISLMVNVGGPSREDGRVAVGSHWHLDPAADIRYLAADHERREIDAVVWNDGETTRIYRKPGREDLDPAALTADPDLREMNCLDCHNRPAHNYRSPVELVNGLLAAGKVSGDIPWIKREAVRALSVEYATSEGARDSIAGHLESFYEAEGFELPKAAVSAVQEAYAQNMFPQMRVRWDRYPDHRGHFEFQGCFRCHGSELRTERGETISGDCNLCHVITAQGPPDRLADSHSAAGLRFDHPIDVDGAEGELPCTDCHVGDSGTYEAVEWN